MDREHLFGGRPLAVLGRLVVLSIIVGIVLSALDITPRNLLWKLKLMAERVWSLGFGALDSVVGYFLLGALIVLPIWLLARLLGAFRTRDRAR